LPKKQNRKSVDKPKDIKGSEQLTIATFLTNLGMRKYLDAFVAQEIEMDTIHYLTEQHLEQLGVSTLGARLRLLAAIKDLKAAPEHTEQPSRHSKDLTNSKDLILITHTLKDSIEVLNASTNRLASLLNTPQTQERNAPIIHAPRPKNGTTPHKLDVVEVTKVTQ